MKQPIRLHFAAILALQLSCLCAPAGEMIGSAADLFAHSVYDSASGGYVMKIGDYQIVPGAAVTIAPSNLTINNAQTILTSDNTGAGGVLLTVGKFTLGPGKLVATGGNTNSSHGVRATGFTLSSGGVLEAYGGSAGSASGVYLTGGAGFVQQGGNITATGGTASLTTGIYVNQGGFQHLGGITVATGGAGVNTAGIRVTNGGFAFNDGTLLARGGVGMPQQSYGVVVSGGSFFRQDGGSITAIGGRASQNYGIYTQSLYTMTGGTLNASGGSGGTAAGVNAYGGFTQTGGVIRTEGGTGSSAHGIHSNFSTFTQNGGQVYATGGSNSLASGIYTSALVQNSGTITAVGSSTGAGKGVHVTGTYSQNGGALDAMGGGSASGVGLYANSLVQAAGSISATGGSAANAYGIYILSFLDQSGGGLLARGGLDPTAYGVNIAASRTATFNGELRLERQAEAASVYLRSGANLALGNGSLLTPVVDLAKIDSAPLDASGLIAGDGGIVTIQGTARVVPAFVDTRAISLGRSVVAIPFIDVSNNGGSIIGEFAQTRGGLFLEYSIVKDGDDRYVLNVTREQNITDQTPYLKCRNSRTLIGLLDGVLAVNADDGAMNRMWDYLENSQDQADWRVRASHVGRTLAPLSYTKLTQSLMRQEELVQTSFFRRIDALAASGGPTASAGGAAASGAMGAFAPSAGGTAWGMWASPLYQQSSRFEPACYEFDDAKERFYGVAAGVGRTWDQLVLGGALHCVNGKYDADYSDIDTDTVGFTLGGRFRRFVPSGSWFDPHVDFAAGYAWTGIDQDALAYDGGVKHSSPDAGLFRIGLKAENPLLFGDRLTLTPHLGIDYSHLVQDGYRESGQSDFLLRVDKGDYDSLRPKIGLRADFAIGDVVSVSLGGEFRYETLDTYSTFRSDLVSIPGLAIKAYGEDLNRASGKFGAGVMYRPRENIRLGLNYDLLLADKYAAHLVEAGFGLSF